MFRFLGYILVSVAKVLDVTSSGIDVVLRPLSRYDSTQSCTDPTYDITPSVGSRHEGRGGRVMSKEDEYHSSTADGSSKPQQMLKRDRAYFESQHRLSDGYNEQAEHLRTHEFKRLGSRVYVDHAGATLYSEKQLEHAYKDLEGQLYTNPHSGHAAWGSDISAMDCEAEARALTLAMCNAPAEEYECIFTSGATGAMRLVAEAFPWSEQSTFAYTLDNHNSVVGMRGYALDQQASAVAVHIMPSNTSGLLRLEACGPPMQQPARAQSSCPSGPPNSDSGGNLCPEATHSLFAYPLESNFSGARYGLEPITQLQQHGMELLGHGGQPGQPQSNERWHVFLDAAKACGSSPPDLRQASADFVALSYYKIFGYPTGLGALLVRKDALKLLRKRYFGGGAVSVSVADHDFFRQRPGAAGFEDGTPAYLGIAALKHGFAQIERFGSFAAIERHTASLTRYLAEALTHLKHANGSVVCKLYGAHALALGTQAGEESKQHGSRQCLPGALGQGPVVAFNLFRSCGAYVGYREVEKVAGLAGIMLRTGCFCNPGACQAHLGLTHDDIISNFEAGHVCWDDQDIIDGRPTGAVRVSFGYMSTFQDAQAVLSFVEQYFVEGASPYKQAESILEERSAPGLPNGIVPHQHEPETAPRITEDSTAEAATQDTALCSKPSMPLSIGQSRSDADEAVLDQAHHSHVAGGAANSGTSSGDCASSPFANSGTAAAAGVGPDLAAEAQLEGPVKLQSIWVYPIKSCAGFAPSSWPLGLNGLLYDREWAIVDVDGEALTQKRLPKLATIKPVLNLEKGVMKVTCPSMPDSITITLPEAASNGSSHQASTATLGNGPAAKKSHRLAKSLPASLQPTPLKALGRARPGSSGPARSTDAQDSDVDSIAGSVVSQSDSFTSHGSRHHVNPAMWPGRSSLEPARSGSGVLRAGSSQAPLSRSGSAAEPGHSANSARGGRGMGSLDVKSVRDRFRHLHSAASLGGASQQSMPSRASIDAYSSPRAPQHSTLKPTPLAEASPAHSQNRQLPHPQGAPASEASILEDFRQSREASPKQSHHGQLPQPQSPHASKASILEDFRQHREALAQASPKHSQNGQLPQPQDPPVCEASILQESREHKQAVRSKAASSNGQAAPEGQGSGQNGQNGRASSQQAAAPQAETVSDSGPAAERQAQQADHITLQRQIQVCSSRVCGLQVGTQEVQEAVSEWFTQALGLKCWLVQQQAGSRQTADREQLAAGVPSPAASSLPASSEASLEPLEALQTRSIGFANEGQFLAISAASLQDVNKRVQEAAAAKKREPVQVSPERFRPNLVFSGAMQPYVEDSWQHLSIGSVPFRVTGQCARCEMVCTDQEAGKRGGPEPLLTLAAYRRTRGRIHFGILLDHASIAGSVETLHVGSVVDVRP